MIRKASAATPRLRTVAVAPQDYILFRTKCSRYLRVRDITLRERERENIGELHTPFLPPEVPLPVGCGATRI